MNNDKIIEEWANSKAERMSVLIDLQALIKKLVSEAREEVLKEIEKEIMSLGYIGTPSDGSLIFFIQRDEVRAIIKSKRK